MSRLGRVSYAHKVGCRPGLLKRRADHQCDRLAIMADMSAGESWTGAPVRCGVRLITGALILDVLMGDDSVNPRRLFCLSSVDVLDTAATDCGRDDDAIEGCLILPVFIGIGGSARDFHGPSTRLMGCPITTVLC